jgi:sulfatase modifying factor 1
MSLLRHLATAALVALVPASLSVPTFAQLVNYEMVTVGNPGNAADARPPVSGDGVYPGDLAGYGNVPYEYRIGKYEVTIGQYVAFLNAVAKDDPNDLYFERDPATSTDSGMTTGSTSAGISRAGTPGAYSYGVIGPMGATQISQATPANRPVTYTGWFSAARFANWMSNGQPTGPQEATTTENGAYDLSSWSSGTVPAMNLVNPNTGSTPLYRIPTEHEWYKAAYYSPLLNSGSGGYYDFATQSNSTPDNTIGDGRNNANFSKGVVLSVTQTGIDLSQNYLTDVGAFSNSPSPYGTFDQDGNVWEWNDLNGSAGKTRGLRGNYWSGPIQAATYRWEGGPEQRFSNIGFRLASPVAVPEPSTYAMALAGLACGGYSVFRRRKRA